VSITGSHYTTNVVITSSVRDAGQVFTSAACDEMSTFWKLRVIKQRLQWHKSTTLQSDVTQPINWPSSCDGQRHIVLQHPLTCNGNWLLMTCRICVHCVTRMVWDQKSMHRNRFLYSCNSWRRHISAAHSMFYCQLECCLNFIFVSKCLKINLLQIY